MESKEATQTQTFYSDKLKRAMHLLLFRRGKMPGAKEWELKEKVGKNLSKYLNNSTSSFPNSPRNKKS